MKQNYHSLLVILEGYGEVLINEPGIFMVERAQELEHPLAGVQAIIFNFDLTMILMM